MKFKKGDYVRVKQWEKTIHENYVKNRVGLVGKIISKSDIYDWSVDLNIPSDKDKLKLWGIGTFYTNELEKISEDEYMAWCI